MNARCCIRLQSVTQSHRSTNNIRAQSNRGINTACIELYRVTNCCPTYTLHIKRLYYDGLCYKEDGLRSLV